MSLSEVPQKWQGKKVLVIGEALLDKYIIGFADRISPDAPVPNVKIEKSMLYLGGIGLVVKFIKSLGGIPELCTVIGDDFEGKVFFEDVKKLKIDTSGIVVDEMISTPQITRIKALNQHLLRLETDYSKEFSSDTHSTLIKNVQRKLQGIDSIVILDYGIGSLFTDNFLFTLLQTLKENSSSPILARPNFTNYHIYENIDLIKMNLQKALNCLSIECFNDTSAIITGKKVINTTQSKAAFFNLVDSTSYLFRQDSEQADRIKPVLKTPVRSYVAVGSTVMAIFGLAYAIQLSPVESAKLASYGSALTASLPPIEFYGANKLKAYINSLKLE